MTRKSAMAAGLVTVLACFVIAIALPRLGSSRKPSSDKESISPNKSVSHFQQDYLAAVREIQDGDLTRARADVDAFNAKYPNGAFGKLLLADVDFKLNHVREAYSEYRSVIVPNLKSFGDSDRLFNFADAAIKLGQNADAATAYRRIISDERAFVDPILLKSVDTPQASLKDLRMAAHALVAGVFQQHGYIGEIEEAVKLTPDQPIPHYMYARLLAQFGRYRDANSELEAAAALLPNDESKALMTETRHAFGFEGMDTEVQVVIKGRGNVSIARSPSQLPNSDKPLVEKPARGQTVMKP